MKRILIATDFSRNAERATEYGVLFAKTFDAEIELFTSYAVSALALGDRELALSVGYLERAQEKTREHLDRLARELRAQGPSVRYTMTSGSPVNAICEHAETSRADLLVLGTQGEHGFDHTFLGSVSERVARAADCPVLTVSAEAPEPGPIRKILVATDFSRDADAAVVWAKALAARTGASIALLHSVPPPFGVGEDELTVDDEHTASEIERSRARLEEVAGAIDGETEVVVGRRYPESDALEQAEQLGADLIAVGTRGRRGLPHVVLGSTTVRIMRGARVPVVSVKR